MSLKRRFRIPTAAAAILAIALAPAALGQGVTTGAIAGTVADQDGTTFLPGGIVTVLHEPTGTRYSSVTDNSGRFRIANVRVGGPYTVTVTMEGFREQVKSDARVKLGGTLDLAFELQLESVDETLYVVAESTPLINSSRTGSTSNVYQEALENLPTVGRGIEDFARTNPFFTVTSEGNNPNSISVAGRNSRYNNIQIDGAVNNDLFGLADTGTPGGQAGTAPISLDAIQELQLVLAPFDVRQGGFSGGGINAVTRSGSNDWKGSLFYFTRDDSMVGDGPASLGQFGDFKEEQYGFRLGGPINKGKVFFFLNAEISESTTPSGWSIDGSGGQTFGNGALTDEANRFRNILIDRYGFDPGGLSQNSRDVPSDKFFGRVDFNIGDRHNLTLRHNFVDAANGINRPNSRTYEFPSETYSFTDKTNSTVLQLNSTLGLNSFNELRLTYQTIADTREGRDLPRFPWIEIEDASGDGSFNFEFEAGTEAFSAFNTLDQEVFELTNDFTWLRGDHTLTFGTHNEFFTFDNLFIQNGFGAYEFTNLDTFEAGIARRYNLTFPNPGQDPVASFDVQQLGVYVGDQWAARNNLTLTYGLRVDVPFFSDRPERNPTTEALYGFRTDKIPDGNTLFTPRAGFNWDIQRDGRQQLRGGLGLFAGRTPYVWISNQFTRNGIVFSDILATGSIPFVSDPFNQPQSIGGASTQEVNLIDPDFEFPTVLRANLAYDRQLPWWGLIGSLEIVHSDSQNEIDYKNLNVRPTGERVPFDGRPIFETVSSDFTGAYLITNTSGGEATNLALKLERPFRGGIWGFVSYAWGESKVINDGTSSRAVSNWQFTEAIDPNNVQESRSNFEVEHRVNASLSYRFNGKTRFPTTVSGFYNLQSGRPFSYIMGAGFPFTSINGDGFTFNDLLYVPATADDVIITNGTWDQLDAFISSDPDLDRFRGGIVDRNSSQAPWSHSLDLRLAQNIPVGKGHLELTFDILNLVNLIDENSGLLQFVQFNTVTPVTFVGTDAETGKPIFSLRNVVTNPTSNSKFQTHNVESRYRMKLGARWTF